jgi:hypothetical protein
METNIIILYIHGNTFHQLLQKFKQQSQYLPMFGKNISNVTDFGYYTGTPVTMLLVPVNPWKQLLTHLLKKEKDLKWEKSRSERGQSSGS